MTVDAERLFPPIVWRERNCSFRTQMMRKRLHSEDWESIEFFVKHWMLSCWGISDKDLLIFGH